MKPDSISLEDSIDTVIRYYADMVSSLAFARTGTKHAADDVFQEVFLRYVRKKPVFTEESYRKAWLIRVTFNCSHNVWNTPWKKKITHLPEEFTYEEKESMDPYHELQRLPSKYREVLHLFYYEQMSLDE